MVYWQILIPPRLSILNFKINQYKKMFPRIRKLSDLSGCLSDTSESSSSGNNASTELFTVKNDEHGFVFIKYKHAAELEKTFLDPALAGNQRNKLICQLRRECRGIVFKKVGEEYEIVLRKFHKFFNVNERPETQLTKIKWNRSFRILEKMDGSLVSPLKMQPSDELKEEKLCFTTMLGFTDVATMVDEYVEKLKESDRNKLLELCNYCIDKKWTPLFEFCSPQQQIVIEYLEESLTLLAIRENESGNYVDFKEMVKLLKDNKWNEAIKVVKVWKEYPSGVGDASNLLKEMYSQMQVEGMSYDLMMATCTRLKLIGIPLCMELKPLVRALGIDILSSAFLMILSMILFVDHTFQNQP